MCGGLLNWSVVALILVLCPASLLVNHRVRFFFLFPYIPHTIPVLSQLVSDCVNTHVAMYFAVVHTTRLRMKNIVRFWYNR